ncbi:tetratricopeptide repeat protein [candidate division CSSED10-310 bacterium]|uniref:histidine kinase n=1 Tax=candidate division CSSED10-310 bacterium TaxID=2855610 RepID=A0ABV6YYP0_UNCC1
MLPKTVINNRYQILEKLGEGGMGEVLLVADIRLAGKKLALKTIKKDVLNQESLICFKKEFDVMTRLKHPNLARVFDFGYYLAGDTYFITMEYVDGVSLKDLIRERVKIPQEKALKILVALSRTLNFIHSRQILHRDIKPANMMLVGDEDYESQLKIMDFGVADLNMSADHISRGTLLYMAPEVLRHQTSKASDVFAAGISFYELITGQLFYEDTSSKYTIAALRNKHKFESSGIIALQKIENSAVREIVQKMIQYEPQNRYQSFTEVILDLNEKLKRSFLLETKKSRETYVLGAGFAGRSAEILQLIKRLENPQDSHKICIVKGAVGNGKTRLFLEFKTYCQLNNILFFDTICLERVSKTYGVFSEMLSEILLTAPQILIHEIGPEVRKILPPNISISDIDQYPSYDPRTERGILVEAISSLIIDYATLMQKNVVLAINDIQWADEGSLSIIKELLYKLSLRDNNNLFLFASIREEDQEKLDQIFTELQEKDRLEFITLKPFEIEEVADYFNKVFGDNISEQLQAAIPQIAAMVHGNPFYLQEVMKYLVSEELIYRTRNGWDLAKPVHDIQFEDNIAVIVTSKLNKAGLKKPERSALEMLTILNRHVTIEEFQQFLPDSSQLNIMHFFEHLERSEILTQHEVKGKITYKFSQQLLRTVLENQIEPAVRKTWHKTIAEKLISLADHNLDEVVEELAYHFSNTNDTSNTLLYLEKAGDKAKLNYANEKAINYYDQLLHHLDATRKEKQIKILHKKGELLNLIARWDEAQEVFTEAIGISEEIGHSILIGESKNLLGKTLHLKGQHKRALQLFEDSFEIFTRQAYQKGIQSLLGNMGTVYQDQGNFQKAMAYYQKVLHMSEMLNNKQGMSSAYGNIGTIYFNLGDHHQAMEYYTKQLSIAEESEDERNTLIAVGNMGLVHLNRKNLVEARKNFMRCKTIAEKLGDKKNLCYVIGNTGLIYHHEGNYQEAMEWYQRQLQVAEELNDKRSINQAMVNIGILYRNYGQYDKALECYERRLQYAQELGEKKRLSLILLNMGDLYQDQKKYSKAEEYYDQAIQIGEEIQIKYYLALYYNNKAELSFIQNRWDESLKFCQQAMTLALETEQTGLITNGKLLRAKIDFYQSETSSQLQQAAINDLKNLLYEANEVDEIARINYEMYKMTKEPTYAHEALTLLTQTYEKTPNIVFREMILELLNAEKSRIDTSKQEDRIRDLLEKEPIQIKMAPVSTPQGIQKMKKTIATVRNMMKEPLAEMPAEPLLTWKQHKLIIDFVKILAPKDFLNDVLEAIVTGIIQITKAHTAMVILLDEDGDISERVVKEKSHSFIAHRVDFISLMMEELRREKEVYLFYRKEYHQLCDTSYTDELGDGYIAVIPVLTRTRDNISGALFIEGDQTPRKSGEINQFLFAEMAREASISIEMAHLNEKNKRDRQDWSRLYEIAQAISSVLDLDELLNTIVDAVVDITDSERGFLMLKNKRGDMQLQNARNDRKQNLSLTDADISLTIPHDVVKTGQPILKSDIESDVGFIPTESIMKLQLKSILCVPLKVGDRIVGVLYVDNSIAKTNFTEYDLNLLTALSAEAAIALENAMLYEDLQEAHRELLQLDEMKTKFITLASHELRTPLTVITGFLSYLEKRERQKKTPIDVYEVLNEKVTKLNEVVANIVDLARLSTPEVTLDKEITSISALIHEVEQDMRPFIEKRELSLSVFLPKEELRARIHANSIWQALANLVLNAIRFTPNGGRIRMEGHYRQNEIEIRVADNGLGIPNNEFENIFKSFYKVDDVTYHSSGYAEFKAGGLGVGLTLAKNAIELCGGKIWVESEVGKGSTFTFTIPSDIMDEEAP